jgi:hypothetical protein
MPEDSKNLECGVWPPPPRLAATARGCAAAWRAPAARASSGGKTDTPSNARKNENAGRRPRIPRRRCGGQIAGSSFAGTSIRRSRPTIASQSLMIEPPVCRVKQHVVASSEQSAPRGSCEKMSSVAPAVVGRGPAVGDKRLGPGLPYLQCVIGVWPRSHLRLVARRIAGPTNFSKGPSYWKCSPCCCKSFATRPVQPV